MKKLIVYYRKKGDMDLFFFRFSTLVVITEN